MSKKKGAKIVIVAKLPDVSDAGKKPEEMKKGVPVPGTGHVTPAEKGRKKFDMWLIKKGHKKLKRRSNGKK